MYPHERSLVKDLANKPFALIGVNSDDKAETVRKAMQTESITWRSFMDGGTGGPIATDWHIRGWPSIFVIDAKGIVRQKFTGMPQGDALDKLIEELLKEAGG